MQIQISWLLQKPTDLDLHCLKRQCISGFSRTRVKSQNTDCHKLQTHSTKHTKTKHNITYRLLYYFFHLFLEHYSCARQNDLEETLFLEHYSCARQNDLEETLFLEHYSCATQNDLEETGYTFSREATLSSFFASLRKRGLLQRERFGVENCLEGNLCAEKHTYHRSSLPCNKWRLIYQVYPVPLRHIRTANTILLLILSLIWPRGDETIFMLKLAEHETRPAKKSQIINSCKFVLAFQLLLAFSYLLAEKISCSAELSMKKKCITSVLGNNCANNSHISYSSAESDQLKRYWLIWPNAQLVWTLILSIWHNDPFLAFSILFIAFPFRFHDLL